MTSLTYKQGGTTIGDLTYTYDAAGNRIKMGGSFARSGLPPALSTVSYNANNQQTAFGSNTITYDLNGNLTTVTDAGVTTTYTWNARNQLTGISLTGFSASFTYDSFGRRTGKTVQGTTTNFAYDGLNPVQEKNGGTVTANLLTGLGIDEFFTRTDGVGTRGLLPDGLGSTVALGDNTGTLQTQYTYEPFGYVTQTGSASTNSYKYTGREDDGSGLYYYRARYYHPRLQRFIAEDPIGFAGGINLYAYLINAPINATDPLGLKQYPDDFIGPLDPAGYYTSQMTVTQCGLIPPAPPGVSISQNMQDARNQWNPFWFFNQVRSSGPWNYKKIDPLYTDFGNFNYGATGTAFGFSSQNLQRAAGWAQQQARTSRPDWGNWYGAYPYGDDPQRKLP